MKKRYDKYKGILPLMHHSRSVYMLPCDLQCERVYTFTVYTKDSSCRKGDFAEEIDVACRSRSATEAKHIAQAVIDHEFAPELYPSRVIFRPEGYLFY